MEKGKQTQDTEAMILRAAEKEFLTKGFSGARTTSIAEAAGVTHAMLHYYFRTKEKLFDRIVAEKISLLQFLLMESVGNPALNLEDRLRVMIESHLDFVAANPELPRFLVGEVFSDPDRSKVLVDKIHEYEPGIVAELQSVLDVAKNKGDCRKVDARMLLIDIISLNVFSYMAYPLINAAFDNIMVDADTYLKQRKKENLDTIMRKLKL